MIIARKRETEKFENLLFSNRALWALILPLFMEQLLTTLVGMADSIMVAQVGEAAVSAVSLVDSVMILLINIFNALATGGAVVAGQYLGSRNPEQARKAGKQMMQFMIYLSVGLMLLIYVGKSFLLHVAFGSIEQDVMNNCNIYLMICGASIPFLAFYSGGAALFRSTGNSKISMIVSTVMNVINVAGNAILVFGLHWGVEGVAIPTLISRIVAAIMMLVLLYNQDFILNIRGMHLFQFEKNLLKKIFVIEDMKAWNPNLRSKTAIRTSDTRYFVDPSIATAALGIGPNDLINDLKTMGLLFETMAIRDLRVYADLLDANVYHYRDKNGLECDAVIHCRNGSYGLVEIKLGGDKLIDEGAASLKKLSSKIDTDKMKKPSFLMVLTANSNVAYKRNDGVIVVPVGALKP